jgi:hypothetical protein
MVDAYLKWSLHKNNGHFDDPGCTSATSSDYNPCRTQDEYQIYIVDVFSE